MSQHQQIEALKPRHVTVRNATRMYGLGVTTLYNLLGQGKIEGVMIGRRRLLSVESLDALTSPKKAA